MQSVSKNIKNVREADSLNTTSDETTTHKCGYRHQVYPHITIAYNDTQLHYKVKQATRWIAVTSITASLEVGGSINCVTQIKHDNNVYIIIGAKAATSGGFVWVINTKSGRLIRNSLQTPHPVTSLACYSNSPLTNNSGILILIGMLTCKIYLTHINVCVTPNPKLKTLTPTKYLEDVYESSIVGISSHPCFEIGKGAFKRNGWHYMLPEMKSNGAFPDEFVSSIAYFQLMNSVLVGYSMGGWQIWLISGSKSILQFTSAIQENIYPVSNFVLLTPENDPHNMLYLWVTHSESTLAIDDDNEYLTTATMYQLQFKHKVSGSKSGIDDVYRKLISLLQSFHFNISQTIFVGKESGIFQKLVDCEAIQKVNILQGCNDFNGITFTFETTKFIITVLFDLNAWYFAQMPHSPNRVARLSPYISYLPLEKKTIPKYCCLQAVKVQPQSLFRGKLSSVEACTIFPSSLNTNVLYHTGDKVITAFYFPAKEDTDTDPGDFITELSSSALKGIFNKHNSMINSKRGKIKLLEFLSTFLPDLKAALNDAMIPMMSGLPTADGEVRTLRHLVSVASHCLYLSSELNKHNKDNMSTLVLYKHTFVYAKTVLALTDKNVLPAYHDRLQDNGTTVIPLLFTSIGGIMKRISGLDELWDGCLYPPKTIRALLNIFFTKPLDILLHSIIVSYSLMFLDIENFDIQDTNILSKTDTNVVKSLFYLDHHQYNNFIKHLPHKSDVFMYCDINVICEILLKRRQRDVAVRMLMILHDEYSELYTSKTKSLLSDSFSSDYRINMLELGSPDMKSFSAMLDEQLNHTQFSSILHSLDEQEKFDCLFFFILQKNKLCDLLSAYGEAQKSLNTSSKPFMEFMFLYAIKHFSDIELKAAVTSQTQGIESRDRFKKTTPLSAQKCQHDLSVLSRFYLKSDLGNLKLGSTPRKTQSVAERPGTKTPPANILDVSDDLLLQLRTPHPTPLKNKVMLELEAPRSILRSCKTERTNRKRIRFGDNTTDEIDITKPTRLSFGGVEYNEEERAISPEKKQRITLTFSQDIDIHEGVPVSEISPPKPFIESAVQCSDDVKEITGIPIEAPMHPENSNDSISFEINPVVSRMELTTFSESGAPGPATDFTFSPVQIESGTEDCRTMFGDNNNTMDDISKTINSGGDSNNVLDDIHEASIEDVSIEIHPPVSIDVSDNSICDKSIEVAQNSICDASVEDVSFVSADSENFPKDNTIDLLSSRSTCETSQSESFASPSKDFENISSSSTPYKQAEMFSPNTEDKGQTMISLDSSSEKSDGCHEGDDSEDNEDFKENMEEDYVDEDSGVDDEVGETDIERRACVPDSEREKTKHPVPVVSIDSSSEEDVQESSDNNDSDDDETEADTASSDDGVEKSSPSHSSASEGSESESDLEQSNSPSIECVSEITPDNDQLVAETCNNSIEHEHSEHDVSSEVEDLSDRNPSSEVGIQSESNRLSDLEGHSSDLNLSSEARIHSDHYESSEFETQYDNNQATELENSHINQANEKHNVSNSEEEEYEENKEVASGYQDVRSESNVIEIPSAISLQSTQTFISAQNEQLEVVSASVSFQSAVSDQSDEVMDDDEISNAAAEHAGAILQESSESESESESFEFSVPQKVAPQNTWFMETFKDHEKISFDFKIPDQVPQASRRVTRSQKQKAISSKDVAPIQHTTPVLSTLPNTTVKSPQSEVSSLQTESSAFSPQIEAEISTSSGILHTPPRNKVVTNNILSSPFTSPLSFLMSDPKVPKYVLKKSGTGTFKLEGSNSPNTSISDLSQDAPGNFSIDDQSFVTVDEAPATSFESSLDREKSSFEIIDEAESSDVMEVVTENANPAEVAIADKHTSKSSEIVDQPESSNNIVKESPYNSEYSLEKLDTMNITPENVDLMKLPLSTESISESLEIIDRSESLHSPKHTSEKIGGKYVPSENVDSIPTSTVSISDSLEIINQSKHSDRMLETVSHLHTGPEQSGTMDVDCENVESEKIPIAAESISESLEIINQSNPSENFFETNSQSEPTLESLELIDQAQCPDVMGIVSETINIKVETESKNNSASLAIIETKSASVERVEQTESFSIAGTDSLENEVENANSNVGTDEIVSPNVVGPNSPQPGFQESGPSASKSAELSVPSSTSTESNVPKESEYISANSSSENIESSDLTSSSGSSPNISRPGKRSKLRLTISKSSTKVIEVPPPIDVEPLIVRRTLRSKVHLSTDLESQCFAGKSRKGKGRLNTPSSESKDQKPARKVKKLEIDTSEKRVTRSRHMSNESSPTKSTEELHSRTESGLSPSQRSTCHTVAQQYTATHDPDTTESASPENVVHRRTRKTQNTSEDAIQPQNHNKRTTRSRKENEAVWKSETTVSRSETTVSKSEEFALKSESTASRSKTTLSKSEETLSKSEDILESDLQEEKRVTRRRIKAHQSDTTNLQSEDQPPPVEPRSLRKKQISSGTQKSVPRSTRRGRQNTDTLDILSTETPVRSTRNKRKPATKETSPIVEDTPIRKTRSRNKTGDSIPTKPVKRIAEQEEDLEVSPPVKRSNKSSEETVSRRGTRKTPAPEPKSEKRVTRSTRKR